MLDLTGPVGSAARRAPSLVSFVGTVKGRAVHSDMEPEKGINAIAIMAKVLSRLPQGHLDEETTCNVGLIQGIVLSNGMYKMHTTSEYTRVEDLWQGSRLVEALILSPV